MVSKGLLACIASGAIASNSLADNVQDIRYERTSQIVQITQNDGTTLKDRDYNYFTILGIMAGSILGVLGVEAVRAYKENSRNNYNAGSLQSSLAKSSFSSKANIQERFVGSDV